MLRVVWIVSGLLVAPWLAMAADATVAPVSAPAQTAPAATEHQIKAPDIDFAHLRDPFKSYLAIAAEKLQALMNERRAAGGRQTEKLENYDIAALKLVAIFTMGEDRVAMLQDAAGQGFVVRRGNFVGKNGGHVELITDDSVNVVEKVLSPTGELIDRTVVLTLKEVNES